MMNVNTDRDSCLQRLEDLQGQIQAIMELVRDKPRLFGAEKAQAQEMLKRLKDDRAGAFILLLCCV